MLVKEPSQRITADKALLHHLFIDTQKMETKTEATLNNPTVNGL